MSGWRQVSLGEVCELKRGYDLPNASRRAGRVPIVSSSGATGFHDEAKVRGPGVVTGRYGTLGEVFYVTEDFWPLNTSLYVRDFKGNDPRFVATLLRTMNLAQYDGAAAVPGLNRNQLHMVPVLVPDTETQRVIASVDAALDDLIENNRRRVAVLEEMARAIYREWFVRFRFPGHENVELVDSALGPVPDGWTTGTVADLCSRIQAGATPKRSAPAYWSDPEFDWYKTGDLTDSVLIHSSEQISALGLSKGRVFEPETILMAIYGSPTVGRLGLVASRSSANQAALGLVADEAVSTTEYLWFVLEGLRAHLNAIAQGAAQQNVSKEKVAAAKVVLPPAERVVAFTEAVRAPWRLSHLLRREAASLGKLRDVLLPKLVSGQVDVSALELDVLVEGAVA
jgi:type I restriction enzyme, S subunit